jgi:adenosylmethionine-8-amino-7-oxononanoate aminotransferase
MVDSHAWAERDAAVVWHGFTQMACYLDNQPVTVEAADGHELIDVDGNRYLDAISSLWVNTLGHRVPELDATLRDQLDRVAHSTLLGNGNQVVVKLAEALAGVVPVDGPHFLFASDGAAAVEQALKIAFQYWANLGVTGRTRYLALGNAYHGDTVGSISLGAGGFGTDLFDPLRFPVLRAPGYDDPGWASAATELVDRHGADLAAVVLEPLVQGAAGMHVTRPDAYGPLVEACRSHDVLLICDEVATGFGRTGTLFASEQCGLRPDLLCIGKGLTGGYLPMAATVASGRVYDAFLGPDLSERTLYHGHSYSGNALAAAVALRHLRLLDERDILANVTARSSTLRRLLADTIVPLDAVREVRIQGLLAGVELAPPAEGLRWGRRVCAAAVRRGVLLRPLGDVVILVPPLSISDAELGRIVDVLAAAIDEVASGAPQTGAFAASAVRERGFGGAEAGEAFASAMNESWADRIDAELDAIRQVDRWRQPVDVDATDAVTGSVAGRPMVSFASNDYLGLTRHPAVIAAAHDALDRWGAGTGGSRLVVGSRPVHTELEAELAAWKGTEDAVLFPTGFAANLGVLATFGRSDVTVLSDELNHASIIDGCRLSRASVRVYRHRDLDHLAEQLVSVHGPALIVTDTVFSMDGDRVDLGDLSRLAAEHDALLMLDEAHAVLGPDLPADGGVGVGVGAPVLRVGTLSKTLGALGGFVAGRRTYIDLLRNLARPFIFTTAPTPADTAAARAALRVVASPEGAGLVARLRRHVDRLRPGHPSPILPVVLGAEADARRAAATLADRGLLVPAIRPPTVPPGTSRLRVALSAAHDDQQIDALVAGLDEAVPGGLAALRGSTCIDR